MNLLGLLRRKGGRSVAGKRSGPNQHDREMAVEMRRQAVGNVRGLAADARLLYQAGRLPRAFALAVLCIEETYKLFALDAVIRAEASGTLIRWADVHRVLSRHEVKLSGMLAMVRKLSADAETKLKLENALRHRGGEGKFGHLLQEEKLKSLYVGIWKGKVSGPDSGIKRETVDAAMKMVDGAVMMVDAVNWEAT